jgi:hypothetical protein
MFSMLRQQSSPSVDAATGDAIYMSRFLNGSFGKFGFPKQPELGHFFQAAVSRNGFPKQLKKALDLQ